MRGRIVIAIGTVVLGLALGLYLRQAAAASQTLQTGIVAHDITTLQLTPRLGMAWARLEADWAALQPEPSTWHWEVLDALLRQTPPGTRILLSLQHIPDWAVTAQGPHPEAARTFLQALLERYPQSVQAVELFPGANTYAAWGAPPNPQAYLEIWRAAQQVAAPHSLTLLALGLTPTTNPQDQDDLAYLDAFLQAASPEEVPRISLRLPHTVPDPLAPPASSPLSVRHHEQVRAHMRLAGFDGTLLWITSLGTDNDIMSDIWEQQILQQSQSFLYLEALFFEPFHSRVSPKVVPPGWLQAAPKKGLRKPLHEHSAISTPLVHHHHGDSYWHGGCVWGKASFIPVRFHHTRHSLALSAG